MMTIRLLAVISALSVCCVSQAADSLRVSSFLHSGPFKIARPFEVDSVDTAGNPFNVESILDQAVPFQSFNGTKTIPSLPKSGSEELHILAFDLQCSSFTKAQVKVRGLEHYKLFADGKEASSGSVSLDPGTHRFLIKCLSSTERKLQPRVSVGTTAGGPLSIRTDGRKNFSLDLNTIGESCTGVSFSKAGGCIAIGHKNVSPEGETELYTDILSVPDGRILSIVDGPVDWMPEGNSFYFTRKCQKGLELVIADPLTGEEKTLASGIPEGDFDVVPGGRYLIYTIIKKAEKEGDVHQILCPDDRQPGWRDRSSIARYDLATGLMQPLTFGYNNVWLTDVSNDGQKLLFMSTRSRLTARPTSLTSLYEMDINTLKTRCLVRDDGFIGNAQYSPDARRILISGSPECLSDIGNELSDGTIPSYYQTQLYIMDTDSLHVRHLTGGMTQSVQTAMWNRFDERIYFTAQDKDRVLLYRIDAQTGILDTLSVREDNVYGFDVSEGSSQIACYGQSLSNGDRVYLLDIWKQTTSVLDDISARRFDGVNFGQGDGYTFTSSRGDEINGFYVLPPDFDPSRKYPMIVHYYGGCSPSERYCTGSYSPQYFAAQGFIFYVVNPSGASGFGQEFASRHVNTAGDGVAEDIIEGVQHFCVDHPFVDTAHIGCYSASYGGFMTQLLLTMTDMFATGISHAGISDHTSYWGEGYWGYNYSEVSMAGNYPWTNKELFVDHSPLYNADKIHTPLLFLHGSADTNVPIGESIQMFTALKLLGQDTAFVVVDGENHGIRDFAKRRQWIRTIAAWFSKYLKEDPSWWNELYPAKTL